MRFVFYAGASAGIHGIPKDFDAWGKREHSKFMVYDFILYVMDGSYPARTRMLVFL